MLLDLKHLLSTHQISVNAVIQPGAHYGQESSLYDSLGIPDENRYYYEPQPHVFEVLKGNIGNRGHLFNCALGNFNGKSTIFIEHNNSSQSSSLLRSKIHSIQYPHIVFSDSAEVDVFRLDDIFPPIAPKFNWLMNIDCQGFELEVLKGSAKILPYVKAIVCEVNVAEVYEGCPMMSEVDNYLSTFGFKRVFTNLEGITWGDALYVNI